MVPGRSTTLSRAALAALALAALAAPASAAAAPGAATGQSAADVRAYWTPERMRDAAPAESLLEDLPAQPLAPVVGGSGATRIVGPSDPAPAERAGPLDGLLGGGGGASGRATAIPNPRPAPLRTHGKVFFTLGAVDYVCSGTAITSRTKRTVVTAGHCVYGMVDGYAQNFEFVPAYDDGATPFGEWTASRLYTTRGWHSSEDIRYDVGMARMAKTGGRRLQAVVGGRGIGFNVKPDRYHAYGYPAEGDFDGETLFMCNSPAQGTDQSVPRPRPRRIDCDMTGGSSGGGWVVRERFVNSVVSYGYECGIGPLPLPIPCDNPEEGKLFGPYFGKQVQALYRKAQRRSSR